MAAKVVVKTYKNQRQFEQDARRMAKRKYQVISTTYENRRTGIIRFILLGFLFPPRNRLIVTYSL